MSADNNEDTVEPDGPVNPFAAPVTSATIQPLAGNPDPPPLPKLPNVFAKWLVVCVFAAGPSFYFGGAMGGWRVHTVVGMVIGVLFFVIGYTALEFTATVQKSMAKPVSRRAAWIAYLTRVGITVIYPVGLFVDVFCGIVAVLISSGVTGIQGGPQSNFPDPPNVSALAEFFQYMFTTVVQGVLLNLVLFAYMGLAWLVCRLFSKN